MLNLKCCLFVCNGMNRLPTNLPICLLFAQMSVCCLSVCNVYLANLSASHLCIVNGPWKCSSEFGFDLDMNLLQN